MRRGSSRGERARERADNSAGDLMSGQVAGGTNTGSKVCLGKPIVDNMSATLAFCRLVASKRKAAQTQQKICKKKEEEAGNEIRKIGINQKL
ncbi:hypothetical protein AAC387_Pa04g1730 [Persea americana]